MVIATASFGKTEKKITIPRALYDQLVADSEALAALQAEQEQDPQTEEV